MSAGQTPLGQILRGSAWSVLLRWAVRGIGLVSTVILARLLTPDDFGVLTLAALVVGLLETMADFGVGLFVIRLSDPSRPYCDTAWTLRALQGLAIGGVIVVSAPLVAEFFGDPRLVDVLRVMALVPALRGLENIGIHLLLRENRFRRDFQYQVAVRLGGFMVTVGLAFALRSYWALVCGLVATELLSVFASYAVHSYRPRPSLAKHREVLRFSVSILVRGMAVFANKRVDVVAIGRVMSTSAVGLYNVVADLINIMSNEIAGAVMRGAFPAYSRERRDPQALIDVFLHSYAMVLLLCAPATAGLFVVADEFVASILGGQWSEAAPLIRWLAPAGFVQSILWIMGGGVLIAAGKERLSSIAAWLQLGLRAPLVVVAAIHGGVEEVAAAVLLACLLSLPPIVALVLRALGMTAGQLFRATWRPVLSASAMAAVVALLKNQVLADRLDFAPALLGAEVVVGGLVYLASIYALWRLSGRPNGPEAVVVRYAVAGIARRR